MLFSFPFGCLLFFLHRLKYYKVQLQINTTIGDFLLCHQCIITAFHNAKYTFWSAIFIGILLIYFDKYSYFPLNLLKTLVPFNHFHSAPQFNYLFGLVHSIPLLFMSQWESSIHMNVIIRFCTSILVVL